MTAREAGSRAGDGAGLLGRAFGQRPWDLGSMAAWGGRGPQWWSIPNATAPGGDGGGGARAGAGLGTRARQTIGPRLEGAGVPGPAAWQILPRQRRRFTGAARHTRRDQPRPQS